MFILFFFVAVAVVDNFVMRIFYLWTSKYQQQFIFSFKLIYFYDLK